MVVQLAQLKGLMESQTTAPSQGQEESNQPLLSLSTEEVFSLLDLNQDGLLQKQEVTGEKYLLSICHRAEGGKYRFNDKLDDLSECVTLFLEIRQTCWSLLQIVSHSRSRDGTWLNPDNLRQILSGLEACPTG